MIFRFLVLFVVSTPLGASIGSSMMDAEEKMPWLIALLGYTMLVGVLGAFFVFRRSRDQ